MSKEKRKPLSKCEICSKEYKPKKRFAFHHHIYPEKDMEVVVFVCYPCHQWLHGRRVFGHKYLNVEKENRGLSFINMALRTLQVFNKKVGWKFLLIEHKGWSFMSKKKYQQAQETQKRILEALEVDEIDAMLQNFSDEETSH